MSENTAATGLNPAALTLKKAAQALGISEESLAADLAAGAPANPDGSINLVHYAAWINRQMGSSHGS
jgi:hypothetical protein